MTRSHLAVLLALALAACSAPPTAAPLHDVLAVGDERGATVAIPADAPRPLVYLAAQLREGEAAELERCAPGVRVVSGLSREERLARAAEFHGADAQLLDEAFLAAATNLRWAQSPSAGVERYLALPTLVARDELVLTNMQGVHGPVIAEHVLALVLADARRLPDFLDAQRRGAWERDAGSGQRALAGSTLLVCGLGGIGSEVARRARGLDMRVLATVRSPRPAPAYVDELGTSADLERFLPEADVVVIALPLTDETRGLFDARRLALMKDDALLVNIGRGPIVDTDALVAALERGELRGACLDVTDPEPLPAGHPLWARRDVILTPHTASAAELTGRRREVLYRENLRRFGAGEPLLNVVDKAAGY